jgi:hypothetical protein
MRGFRKGERGALHTLVWVARVLSIGSAGLLLLFFIGEGFDPSNLAGREWAGLLFFPLGVVAGMAIAWWREGLGGAVSVGSLLAFYVGHVLADGGLPGGLAFVGFTLPGFLFLLYGLLSRRADAPGFAAG